MIIWGWSTKNIGSKKISGTCPKCQSANLYLVGMQRVFDLFWIPTIPLRKHTYITCGTCSSSYPADTDEEKFLAAGVKFKTPWWSFSGLVIIAVLISFIAYSESMDSKNNDQFKENPYVNAYFAFKVKDASQHETPYVFGKIGHIDKDTIQIYPSKYAYSSERMAIKSAERSKSNLEEFEEDFFEVSKEEFKGFDIRKVIP